MLPFDNSGNGQSLLCPLGNDQVSPLGNDEVSLLGNDQSLGWDQPRGNDMYFFLLKFHIHYSLGECL